MQMLWGILRVKIGRSHPDCSLTPSSLTGKLALWLCLDFPASAPPYTRGCKCTCPLAFSLGPLMWAEAKSRAATHPLGCRCFECEPHLVTSCCSLKVGSSGPWVGWGICFYLGQNVGVGVLRAAPRGEDTMCSSLVFPQLGLGGRSVC